MTSGGGKIIVLPDYVEVSPYNVQSNFGIAVDSTLKFFDKLADSAINVVTVGARPFLDSYYETHPEDHRILTPMLNTLESRPLNFATFGGFDAYVEHRYFYHEGVWPSLKAAARRPFEFLWSFAVAADSEEPLERRAEEGGMAVAQAAGMGAMFAGLSGVNPKLRLPTTADAAAVGRAAVAAGQRAWDAIPVLVDFDNPGGFAPAYAIAGGRSGQGAVMAGWPPGPSRPVDLRPVFMARSTEDAGGAIGPEVLTFNKLIDRIFELLERRVSKQEIKRGMSAGLDQTASISRFSKVEKSGGKILFHKLRRTYESTHELTVEKVRQGIPPEQVEILAVRVVRQEKNHIKPFRRGRGRDDMGDGRDAIGVAADNDSDWRGHR